MPSLHEALIMETRLVCDQILMFPALQAENSSRYARCDNRSNLSPLHLLKNDTLSDRQFFSIVRCGMRGTYRAIPYFPKHGTECNLISLRGENADLTDPLAKAAH
jgi:hypothetical protein